MRFVLKPQQQRFIFSPKRYVVFIGGWGCGKTFAGIARAVWLSQMIPHNLGMIMRKEYTQLADSTIQDFELYTGMKVDSHRNVVFPNGSVIMFRHGKELLNINLGWFMIEQAEEFPTDREFTYLRGRLRRKVYLQQGGKKRIFQSGWLIANQNGHNWIWKRFLRDTPPDNTEVVTMTTWDNEENLTEDFKADMRQLERESPEMYQQYVMNSSEVSQDAFVFIPERILRPLEGIIHNYYWGCRVLACDPALGGDECVVYVLEDYKIIFCKIFYERDSMKLASEIAAIMREKGVFYAFIEGIMIGEGIVSRLRQIFPMDRYRIEMVNPAEKSEDEKYANRRAELYGVTREKILAKEIPYPEDEKVVEQITQIHYKLNRKRQVQIESKEDIRARLGCSPDRADAWVIGIWGTEQVLRWRKENEELRRRRYERRRVEPVEIDPMLL